MYQIMNALFFAYESPLHEMKSNSYNPAKYRNIFLESTIVQERGNLQPTKFLAI